MKLILVRHGEAKPGSVDPNRSLTQRGVEDSATVGKFLSSLRVRPASIFTSDKLRAFKTAEIIAGILSFDKERIVASDEFSPMAPVDAIVSCLTAQGVNEEAIIVGHQPSIGMFAGYLITPVEGAGVAIAFETCGVALLEGDDLSKPGGFVLKTLVSPGLL